MTDAKAPERIWAWDWPNYTHLGQWSGRDGKGSTVYVRGDLHDAAIKQRDELAAEVERLKADRLAADHSLVDRYRKPGSGIFSFPEDVAAIIRALDKAEAERDAALARAGAAWIAGRNAGAEAAASVITMGWVNARAIEKAEALTPPLDAQAALDKLIADARADWQPIETALDDDVRILAFVPRYGVTTAHFDARNTHRFICHSVLNREAQPTHWMPLPEPPARINEPQEGGK